MLVLVQLPQHATATLFSNSQTTMFATFCRFNLLLLLVSHQSSTCPDQGPFDTFFVRGGTSEVHDIKFGNDGQCMFLTTTNNIIYVLGAYKGLKDTAAGKSHMSDQLSGARRLRDAIVLGYQLQRAPGRNLSIPNWYTRAQDDIGLHPLLPKMEETDYNSLSELCIKNFEILHGELHGLSDTIFSLKSLSGLADGNDPGKSKEKCQIRERNAATALFNWEDEIYVARAPGRLDVMGGIADYSGSLVLQVSYGSELSNRAPTFDMDLSDLMEGEEPISYGKAYKYFAQDPSQKWAAYVARPSLL